MGVLLAMVLRSRGICVPLWSEVEHTKTGDGLVCWDGVFSGMTCFVLGWVAAGDCGINIPFWDPTVHASSTENLLV